MTNEIKTETLRQYRSVIEIQTEVSDLLERNTFIAYATSECEKVKQGIKKLMIKEFDERAEARKAADPNPVRPDTVVS